ncbi:HlyD family efflux transporter periplasmic adaptor subunit [Lutimonas saemankumensis]|uniref:HlyD family efflux transporter periplasmic adaptor subunit n=1 Tax=Lutimonas saemankumensis TaxID=483016 RepID=UPI001CD343F7|nr:HlyD family efflux transporter periplasmic adaptor subunit [Lutimonas saemankumensis]MCA0932989.1 HlyD family efflux transporter periplasmic adaptor subunit [Lutimonas saemankumensis]
MGSVNSKIFLKYHSEVFRYKFLRRSNKIYLILLLFLICFSISLPLVRIDIYKSAPGIIKSKKNSLVSAKIKDGHVSKFKNLDIHNSIYSGSSIAEMSPQTDLFVECFLSPREIGSVKNNQWVQFQIDVFNHKEWGMASGIINTISSEISLNQGLPVFKVVCSLNESELYLNEFTRGKLKSGMTLRACFFDRKATLLTLLFDQADEWFYTDLG